MAEDAPYDRISVPEADREELDLRNPPLPGFCTTYLTEHLPESYIKRNDHIKTARDRIVLRGKAKPKKKKIQSTTVVSTPSHTLTPSSSAVSAQTGQAQKDFLKRKSKAVQKAREETKGRSKEVIEKAVAASIAKVVEAEGSREARGGVTKVGGERSLAQEAHRRWKGLDSRERRKVRLACTADLKYSTFLEIHEMWKDYMEEAFHLKTTDLASLNLSGQANLTKADLHGCRISVIRSRCPSYVGLSGIVVQETKNAFKLINESSQIKVIPKKNSWFRFSVGKNRITLYGDKLIIKPGERSSKKFKSKPTIDL